MENPNNSSNPSPNENNPPPNTAKVRQSRAATTQTPPSPAKLRLWGVLGKGLLGISAIAWLVGLFTQNYKNPDLDILLRGIIVGSAFAIGGATGAAGIYFNSLDRKAKALARQPTVLAETRRPILYLRSFKDDGTEAIDAPTPFWSSREEEQLATLLGKLGPVIAIGKPGEPLPELGATRIYTGDDNWQQVIMNLMSQAQLVVLRAGATRSFWWEVQTSVRLVRPERIVFLIPDDAERTRLFFQQAQNYLPCQLPAEITDKTNLLQKTFNYKISLKGLLYFEPNWTPHYVGLNQGLSRKGNTLNPLPVMLRYAFMPVIQPLNLAFEPMKVTWVKVGFRIMAGCLLLLILGLIFVVFYMYIFKL